MTDLHRDIAADETEWLIASNKVEGTAVYNEDGERLGSVRHFMVDKLTGQVEYAVLQFGDLPGPGADHYPLPWDLLAYEPDQNGYVVDLDKDVLEDAPHYANQEPVFDRTYDEQIREYYSLTSPTD